MSNLNKLPTFSKSQKLALAFTLKSENPVLLWPGSIRSGKTFACAYALFLYSMKYRNKRFILGGRTVASIYRNIRPYLEEAATIFGITVRTIQSKEVLLIGSNEFHCFGANTEKSQDAMQGMTAQGALLDEVALLPEGFVKQAIARCSESNAKVLMTMNKTSPFHWIKKEFVDEDNNMYVIESDLKEAHWLTPVTKQMYKSLLTGHYGKRMLNNEWAAADGLCYANYTKAICPNEFPDNLDPKYLSIDWGMSGVTAALAFTPLPYKKNSSNTLVNRVRYACVSEYYVKGEYPVEKHAYSLRMKYPNVSIVYVDPSAVPLRTALRHVGFNVVPARNDIIIGIAVTDAALARQLIILDPSKTPNLCLELENLVWDTNAQLKGEDKPVKGNDHAADCLRYFALKRFPPKGINLPLSKPTALQ